MLSSAQESEASILLVDDSSVDLRVLLDMLAGLGMRTFVAFNGQEGVARAELVNPSLILLDVSMPVLDGFGVCRRLKANPRTRDIPVIFLSAATELDRRLEGLSLGAVDYITKPFSEHEVLARVRIHLDIARKLASAQMPQAQARPAQDEPAELPHRELTLLRSATQILRRQIGAPSPPAVLARQLGTNERRLNAAFHAGYGMPIYAWLREERLRQARELLVGTETPIAAIAEHLGYSSHANFARAFNQRFGCAPSRMRTGDVASDRAAAEESMAGDALP